MKINRNKPVSDPVNSRKAVLKRILKYASPYKGSLIMAMLFALLYVVLNLSVPVLAGQAIDRAVEKGNVNFEEIARLLLIIGVIVLAGSLFQWLMGMFINSVSFLTVRAIRQDIYKKWGTVPLSYIDSHPHGDLISRMINDADSIGDGLMQGITQLFSGMVMILCTLGFMVMINFYIAVVVVLITPLSMFVAAFITRISQKMFREQSKTQGEISSYVEEYIGQQKIVKTFGYEEESCNGFEEINERLRICGQKSQFCSSLANPSTRFVNGIVTTAVSVVGAISAINGNLSIGQISAFITYANQYTKPFNEVTGVIPQLQSAIAGAGRVFELLDAEDSSEYSSVDTVENDDKPCKGSISIKNVYFSYTPDKKLIQDFNLEVRAGQRVAIVGPTGCGKTTLINLLMRFYDANKGDILIDGTSIYKMSCDKLRSQFGMVLQESWLFEGTIRENIAYGKPDATLDEVRKAAKSAFIDHFIERLPDGYDTLISEDGSNFSTGQRQLICIARVMLCDPPMLILDEATSSIDTRTELKIQRAMDNMMEGRTSFIVAHRLSTIREADIILVMKDGNIIEQGNHETLLKKKGFYHTLYNSSLK